MLVQALAEYYDTRLRGGDPAFEQKPVPWFLELGPDGRFLGLVPRTTEIQRGKQKVKRVQLLLVPKSPVTRVTGEHPLIAFDDGKYIFGKVADGSTAVTKENVEKKHAAFVALLEAAAQETHDPALEACVAFYHRPDQVHSAWRAAEKEKAGSAAIALSVDGPVIGREAVQQYWRRHYKTAFQARSEEGGEGMCLVCGGIGPIARTADKIKGLASLGGQPAGVALMSFDKAAFRSYGWEQNANSPVCPDRTTAYVLALNDLLTPGGSSRIDHGGVGFVFWTKKPATQDPMALIESADPEQVRSLLLLDEGGLHLDPNEFYMLGVSGNGGRLLVRYWLHESLETVLKNVAAWFRGLRIVNVFDGGIAPPPKLWQILKALSRDEPPPHRAIQLIRRAIHGEPLGRTILAGALNRMRVLGGAEKASAVRSGVIRLCINDLTGETRMSEELDPTLNHSAYLCGRLLAIYDGLQWLAQGDVNSSVCDRYYSLASTYPALAFPKLCDLGLKHLKKVRRERPGAAINIEREIQELHTRLAAAGAKFPPPLSLEDQGRFAIGYHHQKAESLARARARKEERELAQAASEGR